MNHINTYIKYATLAGALVGCSHDKSIIGARNLSYNRLQLNPTDIENPIERFRLSEYQLGSIEGLNLLFQAIEYNIADSNSDEVIRQFYYPYSLEGIVDNLLSGGHTILDTSLLQIYFFIGNYLLTI